MPVPRVVVLTNQAILNLIGNARLQGEFPALRGLQKQLKKRSGSGCRCGGQRARAIDQIVNDFKQQLGGWTPDAKMRLKQTVGADEIRIFVGKRLVTF